MAIISGLIAVGLLGAGFAMWDRVLYTYHGWRLRRNPEYLEEVVSSPAASPESHAVREFVTTEPGRRALLEFYLRQFPEYLEEWLDTYVERRKKDPLLLWLHHPTQYQYVEVHCRSIGGGTMSVSTRIRELQPLLWSVGYKDHALPGREYLKLSCLPWDDYERVTGPQGGPRRRRGKPGPGDQQFGSGIFAIEWVLEPDSPVAVSH